MPEIRTDRMVDSPSTGTGRILITPVTKTERTTKERERINNVSTESGRRSAGAAAMVASIKLLCVG